MMTLYELASDAATALALSVSFHAAAAHDYDDRAGGLGCTADHYEAADKPAPADANAGLLRVSGFAGGTFSSGGLGALAANPIGCIRQQSYYDCTYPDGASAFDAVFVAYVSPLGPGPIAFGGNGGPDFGAFYISGSPDPGTLTVAEDLAALTVNPTQDLALHPTCSPACPSSRTAIELTAMAASSADAGRPYPRLGVVRCVFSSSASIAVPHAAIAAALASDTSLSSITTAVVRLPQTELQSHDLQGNVIAADVGRGVFGTTSR